MLLHIADLEDPGDYTRFRSEIFVLDGQDFISEFSIDRWLTALCNRRDGAFFAISMDGILFEYTSTMWSQRLLDRSLSCNSIHDVDQSALFICGTEGLFAKVENYRAVKIAIGTSEDIVDFCGNKLNNICLIGSAGGIFIYDGESVLSADSPTNQPLCGIAVTKNDEFYICGENGLIIHGKNSQWNLINGIETDIFSVAVRNDEPYFAASEAGLIRLKNGKLQTVVNEWYADSVFVVGDAVFTCSKTEILRIDAEGSREIGIRSR